MTQRKWLAECHAWLDDPTSVQFEDGAGGIWQTARRLDPITKPHLSWRIKPATITINGTELPRPHKGAGIGISIYRGSSLDDDYKYFNWDTREDRDAVYSKLVEVLGS